MGPGDAAQHLEPVPVGGPGDQGVQAVLGVEGVGQLGPAAGEGGVAPVAGVGGPVGVPGLVGAVEVPQPEVDQADRRRGPAVAGGAGQLLAGRLGPAHSLNTFRGWSVTRSSAVSVASSSSIRWSATSWASQPASMRRDMSWRAGIEQKARVSSTNPEVREKPASSREKTVSSTVNTTRWKLGWVP